MPARTRTRTRFTLVIPLAAALLIAGCGAPGGSSSGVQSRAQGGTETAGPERSGDGQRSGFGTEIDPDASPLSTFAMDVDTASYGYARGLLAQGQRPVPDAVRPEEFVNAFRQDYPQPRGDGFSVTLDGARLPEEHHAQPAGDVRLLRVGLQTRAEGTDRPDAALTFVIDVSGSMAADGKLDLVKQSLDAFVDQARPTDSVAIVTFSDSARVVWPMTPVRERAALHAAIAGLQTEGSTDLESGLVEGYRVAGEGVRPGATNRVVLLSDGLANVGDTQAAPILDRVREAAGKNITLLGVGVGNDYGDALMERLADSGDGFVIYVSEQDAARRAFVQTIPAARSIRALDAKVQVSFDPRTVAGYRLIGYDDRVLGADQFRDDRVDGGEVPAGHSVTALYTVRLRPGAGGQVAHTQVRWQDPKTHQAAEAGGDVSVADLNPPLATAGARLQVSYAAAFFAESLRQSPYGTQVPAGYLARLTDAAAVRTEDPAVRELAQEIRQAGG